MNVVEVRNVSKTYPTFCLNNVTFSLESKKITGFIGRNGAGKTTTIKAMLNLIHPKSGEIQYFDIPLNEHEKEIKQKIGYSTGSVSYRKYMRMFSLDENKKPIELSEGMKVKFNLLLALSHQAEILILDEPTSGLDPFSRDELLDLFINLKEHGVTILFSTHITSDLEKCADNIIYIKKGEIKVESRREDFIKNYGLQGESLEEIFLRLEKEERL